MYDDTNTHKAVKRVPEAEDIELNESTDDALMYVEYTDLVIIFIVKFVFFFQKVNRSTIFQQYFDDISTIF